MKIMQKVIAIIRAWLGHTGAYFMITVLLLGGLATLVNDGESSFNPAYFGIAALFSSVLAACDFVLGLKIISSFGIRIILHGVLATADFVVSFIVVSKAVSGSTGIAATVAFMFIYAFIMGTRCIYSAIVRRHIAAQTEYKPLFTPKTDTDE